MLGKQTGRGAPSSCSTSAPSSSVPSLLRGGGGRRVGQLRREQRSGASLVARATVRQCLSDQKLESSLQALSSIQASAVNRYAQDTKSCIISIGLTSELWAPWSPWLRGDCPGRAARESDQKAGILRGGNTSLRPGSPVPQQCAACERARDGVG